MCVWGYFARSISYSFPVRAGVYVSVEFIMKLTNEREPVCVCAWENERMVAKEIASSSSSSSKMAKTRVCASIFKCIDKWAFTKRNRAVRKTGPCITSNCSVYATKWIFVSHKFYHILRLLCFCFSFPSWACVFFLGSCPFFFKTNNFLALKIYMRVRCWWCCKQVCVCVSNTLYMQAGERKIVAQQTASALNEQWCSNSNRWGPRKQKTKLNGKKPEEMKELWAHIVLYIFILFFFFFAFFLYLACLHARSFAMISSGLVFLEHLQ